MSEVTDQIEFNENILTIRESVEVKNQMNETFKKLFEGFASGSRPEKLFNEYMSLFDINKHFMFLLSPSIDSRQLSLLLIHIITRLWFQRGLFAVIKYPLEISRENHKELTEDEIYYIRDNGGWCFKRSYEEIKRSRMTEFSTGDKLLQFDRDEALSMLDSLSKTVEIQTNQHRVIINENVIQFFVLLHQEAERFTLTGDKKDLRIKDKGLCTHLLNFLAHNKVIRVNWYAIISELTQNYADKTKVFTLKTIVEFFVKVKQRILLRRYDLLPTSSRPPIRKKLGQAMKKGFTKYPLITYLSKNIEDSEKVKHTLILIMQEDNGGEMLAELKVVELDKILRAIGLPLYTGKKKDLKVNAIKTHFESNGTIIIKDPEALANNSTK